MTISQPLHFTSFVSFWRAEITCYQRLTRFAAGITFCITNLCLVSLFSGIAPEWDVGLGKPIPAAFRVLWRGLFSCSDFESSEERKTRFPVGFSVSVGVPAPTLLLLVFMLQLLLSVSRYSVTCFTLRYSKNPFTDEVLVKNFLSRLFIVAPLFNFRLSCLDLVRWGRSLLLVS